MRRGAAAVSAAVVAIAGTACGSSGSSNPHALLAKAMQKVDGSSSLHFALTSKGATGDGTNVTGGEGDVARPDQLRGTFQVTVGGFNVSVKVLAAHGTFFAEAPFQSTYAPTDPTKYGIGNPALLLDPKQGLSSLLTNIQNPRAGGQTRVGGELVDTVTGTVPGTKIPSVLPDSAPSRPVDVSALIDRSSHEVRQFILTGPFTSPTNSTYTVTLTKYGEPVHIDLPQ